MTRHEFPLADSHTLSWYEHGQGRPMVLLHGWSMSAAAFSELAEELKSGFRLLIPDLPGHGLSSPVEEYSLSAIAAALAEWIAAVTDQPVCLVGWSLGGMLAIELARNSSLGIQRMVLIGTTPRFTTADDWPCGLPSAQVKAMARNLAKRFEATLSDFFTLAFAGEELPEERLRAIRTLAVRQSPLPNREAAQALLSLLGRQDQRASLTSLTQPTLVIHGTLDPISPLAAAHFLADTLVAGSMVELEGVGHAPFLSRPDVVAKLIMEFC